MEIFSILSPVLTFVGAGLVWWFRGKKPAAVVGFAGLAHKILELVDSLDDEDDVKHEFMADLFALMKEYTAPVVPVDVKAEIRSTLASMHAEMVAAAATAAAGKVNETLSGGPQV